MESLGIQKVEWLAKNLDVSVEDLKLAAEYKSDFVRERTICERDKTRDVVYTVGLLREIQERLFHRILIPKFLPSPECHGAVRDKSILSHAEVHAASRFLYTADIAHFYPSISNYYVYELFIRFGCSPDVSRLLTETCTWKSKLALGLVTSPIIANQVLVPFDEKLTHACQIRGLTYSRFVDDIAISSRYRIRTESVRKLVDRLLRTCHMKAKRSKEECGRIEDLLVTKLRIRHGRVSASPVYFLELQRQLEDHVALGRGLDFNGPLKTRSQLMGKLYFVKWINAGQSQILWPIFKRINWQSVSKLTTKESLVAHANGIAFDMDEDIPF